MNEVNFELIIQRLNEIKEDIGLLFKKMDEKGERISNLEHKNEIIENRVKSIEEMPEERRKVLREKLAIIMAIGGIILTFVIPFLIFSTRLINALVEIGIIK